MSHIKQAWEEFAIKSIPPGSPDIQVEVMRDSFYAGASMIFNRIVEEMEKPDVTNDQGGEFISQIGAEVNEFIASVLARDHFGE